MNQGLDLVLLASPSAAFLHLFIFRPNIFNFLVEFVSSSSSMRRIFLSQHTDNARTSCLIVLCTLIFLCKCTLRSSGYSSFETLHGRPTPVIKMLKGDHQHLADLEMSRYLQSLGKSSAILPQKPKKGHPFYWVTGLTPISQEMRYELKIRKTKTNTPLQPVWTGPYTVVLVIPTAVKVIGVTPWIHHTRVKKAVTSCDDTWKAVRDPKTPSRGVWFQNNGPHS